MSDREGAQTGMRLDQGEPWAVPCDIDPDDDVATLRRVGWLDQKGRVWTEAPPGATFDGGSLTPLLIDVRGD